MRGEGINTLGLLLLLLVVAAPIAWFASEFQDRHWVRIGSGTLAILLSFGGRNPGRIDGAVQFQRLVR